MPRKSRREIIGVIESPGTSPGVWRVNISRFEPILTPARFLNSTLEQDTGNLSVALAIIEDPKAAVPVGKANETSATGKGVEGVVLDFEGQRRTKSAEENTFYPCHAAPVSYNFVRQISGRGYVCPTEKARRNCYLGGPLIFFGSLS
jgi:hypothetical protein